MAGGQAMLDGKGAEQYLNNDKIKGKKRKEKKTLSDINHIL